MLGILWVMDIKNQGEEVSGAMRLPTVGVFHPNNGVTLRWMSLCTVQYSIRDKQDGSMWGGLEAVVVIKIGPS